MTPTVELVVDPDCPNVERARETVRAALGRCGLPARWEERVQRPGDPDRVPSPTVLVDGEDVDGDTPTGAGCRVYRGPGGRLRGAPSVAAIVRALASRRP